MGIFLRLFIESFRFAWQALVANPLRTMLSLVGVTIGIFAIIAVLTVVDALEKSIRNSLSFLGSKVIYVDKWPWTFGPSYPWWKYASRPYPNIRELAFLEKHLEKASALSIYAYKGNETLKYKGNNIGGITIQGVSENHQNVAVIDIETGRFFTKTESLRGDNVAIIGDKIAETLFLGLDPIGKTITIGGNKFRVVAKAKKQGANLLPMPSSDELCMIPFQSMAKVFASGKNLRPTIAVKGFESDRGLLELENEIEGVMRRGRSLKPKEENDFALNRPELIGAVIDEIIDTLTVTGWFISIFSLLVGGFGIANIMFVSVKERTNIIGIQKSLGAKNYFILFQFLFESLFLGITGGGIGLLLVSSLGLFSTESLTLTLTFKNISMGLGISIAIGVVAGIMPALTASRMDPVEAMRTV